jgi:hypothetical protein
MSDRDNEPLDQAVDPPDNNGGTGGNAAMSLDAPSADQQAVDPPDNNGGTGG